MQRRNNAPFGVPALSGIDLWEEEARQMSLKVLDAHKPADPYDMSPAFRWRAVVREMRKPVQNRYPPVGDYGVPMFHYEMHTKNVHIEDKKALPEYTEFFEAHRLFIQRGENTLKWEMEAMLCMGMSQPQIVHATGICPQVVNMYEYYFFDIRAKSEQQLLQYITTSTTPEKYDGLYKYFGAKWGYRMCKHFMSDLKDLNEPDDIREFQRILGIQAMHAVSTAAASYRTPVEQHMSIAMMGMRQKLVDNKIETNSTGVGAPGAGADDHFLELSDNIATHMVKLEDQRAIDIGGRAAADYIQDATKTHMEAAMETVVADVDIITPEDLKELNFQQDSGDS